MDSLLRFSKISESEVDVERLLDLSLKLIRRFRRFFNNKKVIVVAPSKKTRGGISEVIKLYETTSFWNKWDCIWIGTYRDGSSIIKIWYFIKSLSVFFFTLPFSKIVHIHLSEPISAFRKSFFFWPAYLMKKKCIIHFHATSVETTLNSVKRKLYTSLFNKADIVIVLSQYWANHVEALINNTKTIVEVVYNPSPIVCTTIPVYKRNPVVLFAGTLNDRKGFKDLIISFQDVAKKYPNWKLVFAGNGKIEEGIQLSRDLKISSNVEFVGWVSGEEKKALFNSSSIFCLPSYAEGFPMAVLDAWAHALPVVCTPVGGLIDVLNNSNALVFEPGDVEALSNHLIELISNPILREELSIESKKISDTKFNLETISKQIDGIYSILDPTLQNGSSPASAF